MATYIKNDVQNVLINFYNKGVLATTVTRYRVLRTILRNRLNGTRFCRNVYNNK